MQKEMQDRLSKVQQNPGKPPGHQALEHECWVRLNAQVDNPGTARLIVQFLDAYPEQKGIRGGIYLLAMETIRRDDMVRKLQQQDEPRLWMGFRVIRLVFRAVRDLYRLAMKSTREASHQQVAQSH